jgi:AcrR family transcriptional regulator
MKKAAASAVSPASPAPRRPRGRPRAFDREAALASAMEVFRAKGFEATSIHDLTDAMGINPPSLYSAFGDKESLFLEAIERYSRDSGEECPYCSEPTARGALQKYLDYAAHEFTEDSECRGCLLTMAATTSVNISARLQKLIAQKRAHARERIRERIKRGVEEGDVPAGTDASALADFYVTILNGMALQAREGSSRKALLAVVEHAMSVFPKVQKKKLVAAA